MVKVYVANVSELPDPKDNPEHLKGLSDVRVKKIMRCRQTKDRKQSLGAGLLLTQCLKEYRIDTESIRYGEHGKPEVEGICFNLSHSQDMVVCAVSGMPVGCDIEKIGELKEGIAERFFTKNEVKYLERFQGNEKRDEFYRLWTMKESYMKMTGEGMSLSLDCFEFIIEDRIKVFREAILEECYLEEYMIPGYKLTVCAKENEFVSEVKYVSF